MYTIVSTVLIIIKIVFDIRAAKLVIESRVFDVLCLKLLCSPHFPTDSVQISELGCFSEASGLFSFEDGPSN